MKDKRLKTIIEAAKGVSLSESERASMRARLDEMLLAAPQPLAAPHQGAERGVDGDGERSGENSAPAKSPYWRFFSSPISIGVVAVALVILIGKVSLSEIAGRSQVSPGLPSARDAAPAIPSAARFAPAESVGGAAPAAEMQMFSLPVEPAPSAAPAPAPSSAPRLMMLKSAPLSTGEATSTASSTNPTSVAVPPPETLSP